MAHVISTTHAQFNPVEALRDIFAASNAKRQQNRVYRKTCNELMALSDRSLRDLGLGRSDINRVALEAAIGSAH